MKSKNRPADANKLAHFIVQETVSEDKGAKDPNAVILGRKGGLVGGKARAAKMTPEERSEAARNAAHARWNKDNK